MIARCGLDCTECYAFPHDCSGCSAVEGKPYWTKDVGEEQCQLYRCSAERSLAHCGNCQELPCKLWYELKDPSWSKEEHQQGIEDRVKRLKGQ